MLKKLYILITVSLCLSLSGCIENEIKIDPNSTKPEIKFAYINLLSDLNIADNLPIVAVVKAQAGLKSVVMKIQKTTETIDYKTVTSFFNNKSYSLAEKINFGTDCIAFIVSATDLLNHVVNDTLPLNIVALKAAPVIVFDPKAISFSEIIGGPMPNTKFTVTSSAGLKRIEMFMGTQSGQIQYGLPIDFINNETIYTFDQQIMYQAGNTGFMVKATDIYGQIKIETLPVQYVSTPPPTITVPSDTIYANKDEVKPISMQVGSQTGIANIKIYRREGLTDNLVSDVNYSNDLTLNILQNVTLTNATSKIRIVVTDKINKSTEKLITTIVNLQYVKNVSIGSQVFANANSIVPNVFAMFSLKDMKTYTVDYAMTSDGNSANVDFKFYVYGSAAVLRMYSIDGGTGTKSNEFLGSNGNSVVNMTVQNATKLLKLSGYSFENATAQSIANDIPAANITSNNINPFVVGDIIAFKTANTSSSGGGRIGIMKILSDTQVNSTSVTSRVITVTIKFPNN